MKPEGMSTSGLLTLGDAQGHDNGPARPGWLVAAAADRNWIEFSALASCRMMASRRPRAIRAFVARAGVLMTHAIPAAAGAVYGVEGQAHAAVAPRLVKDNRRSARA
jgi:hypothetical protein